MDKPKKVNPFMVDEPVTHDLKNESHDEFWEKECMYHPDREECRIYED